MVYKKAVGIVLLALTCVAVAQQAPRPEPKRQPAAGGVEPDMGPPRQLIARQRMSKKPAAQLAVPGDATGRLRVKFMDQVKARPVGAQTAFSRANGNITQFQGILMQFGLIVSPQFSRSEDVLALIEAKTAAHSGRAQPDLAGMMLVTAPGGSVPLAAARAINDLPEVEFVEFERRQVINGPNGACCYSQGCVVVPAATCLNTLFGTYAGDGTTCITDPCGACCISGGGCGMLFQDDCTAASGTFAGSFTLCSTGGICAVGACCESDFDCVQTIESACEGSNGTFKGADTTCGGAQCGCCCLDDGSNDNTVQTPSECEANEGNLVPGVECVTISCEDLAEPDCGVPTTGNCFEPNGTPFCNIEECCQDVCEIDPFCCDEAQAIMWPSRTAANGGANGWDAWCACHAFEICFGVVCPGGPAPPAHDPDAPTPNFTAAQGYLTAGPYPVPPPPDIASAFPFDSNGDPLPGYTGEGFDLQSVWNVGEILIGEGFGTQNLTRGATIKLGIIEHAAFLPNALGPQSPYAHEDLSHVITEPEFENGFLIIPGGFPGAVDIDGHHGTATLGIAGARNQRGNGTPRPVGESPADSMTDQLGCVGMAPDADLYFFSITTLGGEGTPDAIVRALDPTGAAFGPGDVLSFSIGPGGCGTLASDGTDWTMLRLAADAGVTCCIAAGNSCCNLDEFPQAGSLDCDAIIVGACYPGGSGFNAFCRLNFSNFCGTCEQPAAIHISAWGDAVATLGYGLAGGGIFTGNDPGGGPLNRTYTNSFGGTSAAAPQIAGLVACLQGLAKMRWGIPLSPAQVRSALTDAEGFFQCGFEFVDDLPGSTDIPLVSCDDVRAGGDWNSEGTGNRIGCVDGDGNLEIVECTDRTLAFTNAFDDAVDIVAGGYFGGNPFVEGVEILHGTLISGNVFSIKSLDGNSLRVRSALTLPQGPGVVHRGDLGSGQVTDVMVTGTGQLPVGTMSVTVSSSATTPFGVMVVYLFNFETNKWRTVGVSMLGGFGFTQTFPLFTTSPSSFVASDLSVKARVWTLSVNTSEYDVFHDLIQVDINTNPFVVIPP